MYKYKETQHFQVSIKGSFILSMLYEKAVKLIMSIVVSNQINGLCIYLLYDEAL